MFVGRHQLILLVIVACAGGLPQMRADAQTATRDADEPKEKAVYSNTGLGRDPQAFDSAAAMYKVAAKGPCDGPVAPIAEMLRSGASLDSTEVQEGILALNPCRQEEMVQTAASEWADLAAARLGGQTASAPPNALAEANRRYAGGDFKTAAARYLELLRQAPGHLDARNNLALASMHLGNDLGAEVELEALRRLDAAYLPALVNLTVVYERQGMPSRALAAARDAVRVQKGTPAAAFNLAWYASLDGAYPLAESLLEPLAEINASPSHRSLCDLNHRQLLAGTGALLLVEDFDDASLGWGVYENGQYYDAGFSDGAYVVTTKNDRCSVEYVKPQFELPVNFDIELVSTWKAGVDNTSYGFDFGQSKDNVYHFGVSGNGQSVIWEYSSDDTVRDPMDWKKDTANRGDGTTPNVQRIAVRGDLISYYVNGVYVGSFVSQIPFKPQEWTVGVRVCREETAAFDRLRIIGR